MKKLHHVLAGTLALAAGTVQAHPGDHGFTGVLHFFTEPDHVAIMAGVSIGVIFLVRKLKRDHLNE